MTGETNSVRDEVERSVIGLLLLHADAVAEVAFLRPEDFYLPACQAILPAIRATYAALGKTDPLLVGDELGRRDRLHVAGGLNGLIDFADFAGTVAASSLAHFAKIVRENGQRRRVANDLRAALDRLHVGGDVAEVVAEVVAELAAEADKVAPGSHKPVALSAVDVLDRWGQEGELVHVATGIPTLDAMTRGGPTLGSVFVPNGAPNAGKTALVVQLLDHAMSQGAIVGILAVDESDDGVVTRFLQRRGHTRQQCEKRRPKDLEAMRQQVAALPLRIYGPEWTIEAAAADTAEAARTAGTFGVFGADSIQMVRCDSEDGTSRYEAITARMGAARAVAARHRLLVVVTSEMNRGGYRSKADKDRVSDMAASSGSGAIEYGARLAISLRASEADADLIELRAFKNKFGPEHKGKDCILLSIDREMQLLTEQPAQAGQTAAETASREERDLRAEHEQRIQRVLEIMADLGGTVRSKETVYALMVGKTPRKRAAFDACLVDGGPIVEVGRGNRRTYRLVAAAGAPGGVRVGSHTLPHGGEGRETAPDRGSCGAKNKRGREGARGERPPEERIDDGVPKQPGGRRRRA